MNNHTRSIYFVYFDHINGSVGFEGTKQCVKKEFVFLSYGDTEKAQVYNEASNVRHQKI